MTIDERARELVEDIKLHSRQDSLANVNWLIVRGLIATAIREAEERGLKGTP